MTHTQPHVIHSLCCSHCPSFCASNTPSLLLPQHLQVDNPSAWNAIFPGFHMTNLFVNSVKVSSLERRYLIPQTKIATSNHCLLIFFMSPPWKDLLAHPSCSELYLAYCKYSGNTCEMSKVLADLCWGHLWRYHLGGFHIHYELD